MSRHLRRHCLQLGLHEAPALQHPCEGPEARLVEGVEELPCGLFFAFELAGIWRRTRGLKNARGLVNAWGMLRQRWRRTWLQKWTTLWERPHMLKVARGRHYTCGLKQPRLDVRSRLRGQTRRRGRAWLQGPLLYQDARKLMWQRR